MIDSCFLLSELDETTEQQVLSGATDRASSWIILEKSRESRHWLPWRPNYGVGESSIEDCEDPERVVVFDDLSAALFGMESTQDRFYLLCTFLDFAGKYLPSSIVDQSDFCFAEDWNTDSNLWWELGEAFPDTDSLSAFAEVQLAQCQLDKLCTFVENVYTQTIGLFDGDFRTALTLRYVHFKTATLSSRNYVADRRRRKHAEKELRNFFKSLLKQEHNRSNLAVWERYARFEWEIGNHDDARKVFETALAMAGSAVNEITKNSETSSVIRLYGTYSRLELGMEIQDPPAFCSATEKSASEDNRTLQAKRALHVLAMAVNGFQADSVGADISAPELVRARHFYQRHLDDMHATFAAVDPSDTEQIKCLGRSLLHWTSCYALLQLLTVGLPAASSILQNFQTSLRRLPTVSTATVDADSDKRKTVESHSSRSKNSGVSHCRPLLRSAARLHVQFTQFCLSNRSAPLNVVRTALSDALAEFPDDVGFLKMFVDIELSSHISGRLQEYFHRAVNGANTPLPVLYAVLAGRKRLLRLTTDAQAPCK